MKPPSSPVMVVRDDEGRLRAWWPDLTGRPAAMWLELDLATHDPEEAVRNALFVLHGAEPPRSRLAARERLTPWGGSVLDGSPLTTWERLLRPPWREGDDRR